MLESYIIIYSQPNKKGKIITKETKIQAHTPEEAIDSFKKTYCHIYDNIEILNITLSLF